MENSPFDNGLDLLATISHEVRAPLTIIRGNLDLLLRGLVGPTSDEQRVFLESARFHAGNLATSFQQLSLFLSIESGNNIWEPRTFALSEVIEGVIKRNITILHEKRIQFQTQEVMNLGEVYADFDHVHHILEQIVKNAVQFSQTEGEIIISRKQEVNCISLNIEDKGIGIPEKDQPFLFDRHHYIHRTTNILPHHTSLRLGLHIVQRLARKNSIDVSINSIENAGTIVFLRIPTKKAA